MRSWSQGLEGVLEAGSKDPHGLYTAVTKSILHTPTYVQRGVGGTEEQYRPMEELIRKRFLPCIMGRPTRDMGDDERAVYALPSRMGGLGVKNLMETAKPSHDEAREATNFLVESLLEIKQWSSSKHDKHFTKRASDHKAKRGEKLQEQQKVLKERYINRLPPDEKKACENAMSLRTHYALVSSPSASQDTYLTPVQFRDLLAVRYGKEPVDVPPYCACEHNGARRKPYTLEHALVCGHGGNVIGRHNIVVKELKHIAATATGGTEYSVDTEVWLREPNQDNMDGLRSDIQIRGLESGAAITQIDVRVCYPNAQSYQRKSTKAILKEAENEKKRIYEEQCVILGHRFVPFAITTDGALGEEAEELLKKLAKAITAKWKIPESHVKTWIRHRLAIALAKACSACIRGSRARGMGVGGPQGWGIGGLNAGQSWRRHQPPPPPPPPPRA